MTKLTMIMPVIVWDRVLLNITKASIDNLRFFTAPDDVKLIVFHNMANLSNDVQKLCVKDDVYIPLKENLEITKCYNQGFKMADSEYIGVLSNDVFVHQDWFYWAEKALSENKCEIFVPFMNHYNTTITAKQSETMDSEFLTDYSFSDCGCSCFVMKKKTFLEIGDFDESMRVYWDRDMKLRLEQMKMRVKSDIRSQATHVGPITRYYPGIQQYWDFGKYHNQDIELFKKKWGKMP